MAGKSGPGAKTMKSDGSDYQIISPGMVSRGQHTQEEEAMVNSETAGTIKTSRGMRGGLLK